MATFTASAIPSAFGNTLFDPAAVDASVDTHQRNALLVQEGQQKLQDAELSHISDAAAWVSSLPEDQRPAAYQAAVQQLRSVGFARNAPSEYPGHDQIAALAHLGIPASKQIELAANQQAIGAMFPGGGTTPAAAGGTAPAAPVAPFEQKMSGAESGGDATKVNPGGYSGQFQFGAARLADLGVYKPAPGEDLSRNEWKGTFAIPGFKVTTHDDFLNNAAAQHQVFFAHVADVDRAIANTPGAAGFDPNGLRAVAHLGGVAGMQRFVSSGGAYDPADANGTRLSDYYARFAAGGAPALQKAFGSPHGPGGPPDNGTAATPSSAAAPASRQVAPQSLPGAPQILPSGLTAQQEAIMRGLRGVPGVNPATYANMLETFQQHNQEAAHRVAQEQHQLREETRQAAADKLAQEKAAREARNAAQPYQGTGIEAQDANVLLTEDPSTQKYAGAYARTAAPKVNLDGSTVTPNMAAYATPTYRPSGAAATPDYGKPATTDPTRMTADQGKVATYASRMRASNTVIDQTAAVGTSLLQRGLQAVPGGNYFASPEAQLYDQAQRDFINATLRRESGAAIAESEFANARKQYFPQPGDGPDVIAQKARNRATVISGFEREAGPAYKPPAESPAGVAPHVAAVPPPPPPGFRVIQ